MNGPRRVAEVGSGESFSSPVFGIHRMEHDSGAVTIHVYSPPLREIGHYDVVDGELRREPGPADEVLAAQPRPGDRAALAASANRRRRARRRT